MNKKQLTQEQVDEIINSQEFKDAKTLVAFSIRKSKTTKDDEILENIDAVAQEIAENVKDISDQNPSDKDAKDAAFRILKSIAEKTQNKWDNRVIDILDLFI